jgi:hypothetical protein
VSRSQLHLERVASHGTRAWGFLRGERAGQYYVVEFPKSGGSWLADMLAAYFELPRPQRPTRPVLEPAVIHAHWAYTPRLRRVAYIVRDVRDVTISAYFRWLWEIRNPRLPQTNTYFRRRAPVLFRPDADDIRTHLPQFVREFAACPVGTRLSWSAHVGAWRGRPAVSVVGYEELLESTETTLAKLIVALSGSPDVNEERLEAAVHENSFERRSGRSRGVEDRTSFLRRGVAGDWRNHCSREAAQILDQHFGETLVALGYESNRDWWRELGA